MRQHLKAWLKARKPRRQNKEVDLTPEIPCVTSSRPRVLTPSPSEQDVSLPPQSSPVFTKLPTEIRQQILLFAFGDRTVHMDLALEHPGDPEIYDMPDENGHGKLGLRYSNEFDRSQPRIWKWRGCVCHRVAPPRLRKFIWFKENAPQPADDKRCSGWASFCYDWTRHYGTRDACMIGAMGWLLACRQSYTEGLDVLYRTNTIHLSSKALISNLTRFILPHRFAMMSSLEIVWLLDSNVSLGKSIPEQRDLDRIISILDKHFPRLQRLNLALKLRLYQKIPVELDEMIKTLDSFVARRAQYLLEPITISLASWAFEQLHEEVFQMVKEEKGLDSLTPLSRPPYKVWRYLDGSYDLPNINIIREAYGRIEGATARNGYWFWKGDDEGMVPIEQGCPGSSGGPPIMMRDTRFTRAPRNPT